MFSSDFMRFVFTHHLGILIGIAIAIMLAKYKISWLAYFIGFACDFSPMWNDYKLLSRAGYGYAMNRVIGEFTLIAIVGAIVIAVCRNKQKNEQQAAKNVVFYCPACKGISEGAPGNIQGCPVCHKPTKETSVRYQDWTSMSEQQQAELKQSWEMQF